MVVKSLIITFIGVSVFATPAFSQFQLSLVEGAACAQSAAHIEALERYNKDVYDEISDKQSSSDRLIQNEANALLIHYERMVAFRQNLINEYELVCARGSMGVSNMKRVCGPQSNGKSFIDTVFCKPIRELQE